MTLHRQAQPSIGPVSVDHRLPLYQQLKELFVGRIREQHWRGGMPIPSEIELSSTYKVAPGTVRRAIDDLVAEKYLVRQQGRGTFVREVDFGNALFRFFRHTDESGQVMRPSARIVSVRVREAHEFEKARLGLTPREPVLHLQRVRYIGDEPLLFEEISLSERRFRPLAHLAHDEFGDLLYPLYSRACGVRIHSAVETIRFGSATRNSARHLNAGAGVPVAIIERLARDLEGKATEWRLSQALASRFSYSIELK